MRKVTSQYRLAVLVESESVHHHHPTTSREAVATSRRPSKHAWPCLHRDVGGATERASPGGHRECHLRYRVISRQKTSRAAAATQGGGSEAYGSPPPDPTSPSSPHHATTYPKTHYSATVCVNFRTSQEK
ncbi:hypothetical protein E2C01_016192 [Portunus trituberculatus]|uniref:Uncharacterized protein n=1 Tax=Portunus trituberculatus TaxID=210409 RepID=A0A5B7DQB1_PORTR|nr:hypothetical protein [Portunus trituberculatus]